MRLPITPQISTKDGVSAKNARLTNCLKESKKAGDKAVVRPGLVLDAVASGVGNGLVVFNNELVSVYGATLGFGPTPAATDPLDIMFLKLNGTITDECGHVTTVAASGNFTSVQVACGSQSYLITSESDHIIITPKTPNAFAIGATDFTVEGWIYYVSGTATMFRYSGGDTLLEIVSNEYQAGVNYEDSVDSFGLTSGASIAGAWHHLAVVGDATGLYFYVDGSASGTIPLAGNLNIPDLSTIQVGGGNAYFNSVRFYNGAAYSGAFSPECYLEDNTITALDTIAIGQYDFAQSPL